MTIGKNIVNITVIVNMINIVNITIGTDNICDNKLRIKKEGCIFINGLIGLTIFVFMNGSKRVAMLSVIHPVTDWRLR